MSRVLILGATGSLGRHVLRLAVSTGHEVTVFVRTPSKLSPELHEQVSMHTGDLSAPMPLDLVRGQDALINCAGHVADGETFVGLVDRLVTTVDSLPEAERPVCWLLAGAALLDIDSSGRRGVDLSKVSATYWPHRVNFERLSRSRMDWRLALSRADGRRARSGTGPDARLNRRSSGSGSRIRRCAAPRLVGVTLRVADSGNDRALRRRGGPDARES